MKRKPAPGDKIYELSPNNTMSEWIINSISKDGLSSIYTLAKENGDSFCTYSSASIGKDIFTAREDAVKARDKRNR